MNDLLSNGLKSIVELARTETLKPAYECAEQIVFLDRFTGNQVEVDKQKPTTKHTLDNIDSLINFIDQRADEDGHVPYIFIRPTSIVCILDYSEFRVHQITVPLSQSPILSYLSKVAGNNFEPKEAIRSLKYNLKSAILTDNPIPSLQTLKFSSSSSAEHETNWTSEGVSKSLQSSVTGAATVPEEFSVQFEMYPAITVELEAAGSVTVEMELHVDPTKQTLSFRPFPGSIDRAILMAQQDVQKTVVKKLIGAQREPLSHLVFLGQP
jgi:hypothetical protein